MADSGVPLLDRFPALRKLPRVTLCTLPSPVELLPSIGGAGDIWIKRDDLNAPAGGGNKVRTLEFLLGNVKPGDAVLTVGGAGSNHVLATAIHAARLGATATAFRWKHDMNPAADLTAARIAVEMPGMRVGKSAVIAVARARLRGLSAEVHYIPLGGSSPLGALGHVNAALELAAQIEAGEMPRPDQIVLPLGSGGTAAGLLLGFALAGLDVTIVGARVGPRFFASRYRVLGLAHQTARLIERFTGERLPAVDRNRLRIAHQVYGGAYGRPLAVATEAAATLKDATGIQVDATYSAKAFVAALDEARAARGPTLFWLTFDARCLTN